MRCMITSYRTKVSCTKVTYVIPWSNCPWPMICLSLTHNSPMQYLAISKCTKSKTENEMHDHIIPNQSIMYKGNLCKTEYKFEWFYHYIDFIHTGHQGVLGYSIPSQLWASISDKTLWFSPVHKIKNSSKTSTFYVLVTSVMFWEELHCT